MRNLRPILIALIVLLAPAAYAVESFHQCLSNCPQSTFRDDDEPCKKCCMAQYQVFEDKCEAACTAEANKCRAAVAKECNMPDEDRQLYCVIMNSRPCSDASGKCRSACWRIDPEIAGGCPGEVPPQPCAMECWRWNTRTKRCEGPPSCGGRGR